MRLSLLSIAALATALCSASALSAQTRPGPGARKPGVEQRAAMREKLKNATPEQRKAALEKAKERREAAKANATDEQKAWVKAMNAQRQATQAAVKAGTITRQTAAQQLKAWRDAHPRPSHG